MSSLWWRSAGDRNEVVEVLSFCGEADRRDGDDAAGFTFDSGISTLSPLSPLKHSNTPHNTHCQQTNV